MRTNKTLTKKSVRKVASLLILAICFTVAFTFTLAVGTKGMGTQLTSPVVSALKAPMDQGSSKDSSVTDFGTATPIDLSKQKFLNSDNTLSADTFSAVNMMKRGGAGATSWTEKVDLSSITLEHSNDTPTNIQVHKAEGKAPLFVEHNPTSKYGWKMGILSSAASTEMSAVLNFKLPNDIIALVDNDNFTVSATLNIRHNFQKWASGDNIFTILVGSPAVGIDKPANGEWGVPPIASNFQQYPSMQSQGASDKEKSRGVNSDLVVGYRNSDPVTLHRGQSVLSIGFAWSMKGSGVLTYDKYVEIETRFLTFNVTLNNANDNVNTYINDGGVPVQVSQALVKEVGSGDEKTTVPLSTWAESDLTIADSANNNYTYGQATSKFGERILEEYQPYTTDVTKMSMYFGNVAGFDGYLNEYKDSRTATGDTTLNSLISLGQQVPSSSDMCRKSAKIEYADTYNYAGVAGGAKFNAKDANAEYLKYAGISGYTLNGSNWEYSDNNVVNRMASGIRTVRLDVDVAGNWTVDGGVVFDVYSISNYEWKKIEATSTAVGDNTTLYIGWARVTKNSRANVTVELYINHNASVTVTVLDFGGSIKEEKDANGTVTGTTVVFTEDGAQNLIEFKGIDTTEATAEVAGNTKTKIENTDFCADKPNPSNIKFWYKSSMFEVEMSSGEENDDDVAPYLWFYTVQTYSDWKTLNVDSLAKPITSMQALKDEDGKPTRLPIAVGSFTSFRYDFTTGYALVDGVGSYTYDNPLKVANPPSLLSRATGVGYYAFTFYKTDLAGNVQGEVSHQFVKVDYIQPKYDLNFSYKVNDKTTNIANVYQTYDNAQWALGEATLTISIKGNVEDGTNEYYPGLNFAGNCLRFNDISADYMITFDREGNLHLYYTRSGKTAEITDTLVKDGKTWLKFTIETDIDKTEVYVAYNAVYYPGYGTWNGTLSFNFQGATDNVFPTVAWMTKFDVGVVAYESMAKADEDGDNALFADTRDEAKIFIDRNNPELPYLTDADDEHVYIYDNNNTGKYDYTVKNESEWKTDNYKLDANLNFNDFVAEFSTFAPLIKVYVGFKFVNSLEELEKLKNYNMASKYANITEENKSNYLLNGDQYGLNMFRQYDMGELSNGSSPFPIEFVPTHGAGMRVLFLWVRDQAGRVSSLYTAYVLVDANDYTVKSEMVEAMIGDVSFGANGTVSHVKLDAFGDDITTNSFKRGETVKFLVTLQAGYVPYLLQKSPQTEGGEYLSILENYTHRNTMTVTKAFEGLATFALGSNPNEYVLEFKLDDKSILTNMAKEVNFEMSARRVVTKVVGSNKFYDAKNLDMSKYVTVPEDSRAVDSLVFGYYASADATEQMQYAPLNVGTYYVTVSIPRDNPAFVMTPSAEENKQGKLVPTTFNILKGSIKIIPNASQSVFGDTPKLSFTVEGFDFDGVTTGEKLNYDTGANLKYNVPEWNILTLYNVGSYNIIYVNEFKIVHYDGSVSDNFDVEFVYNVKHTVNQRTVVATVYRESKNYGDSDPAVRFAIDTSEQFKWYSGTADYVLGRMFGEGNYAIYGEPEKQGNIYIYNSNGRIARVAGENAGTYKYIQPTAQFDLVSNNYILQLTVTDEDVFTINKRPVTLNLGDMYGVIKYGATAPLPADIRINYTLDGKDVRFASEIAGIVGGNIVVQSHSGLQSPDEVGNYSGKYVYPVTLNATNENFAITLSGDRYNVYVTQQGIVVVRLKDGKTIDFQYGTMMSQDLVKYSADLFEYSCDKEVEFTDIRWTVAFGNVENNAYIPVGKYKVSLTDAKLYNGNTEVVDQKVVVESFTSTVSPADIVVKPSAGNTIAKVYGADENKYEFIIASINGIDVPLPSVVNDYKFAGLSYKQIKDSITGSYVRGRFDVNGNLRYIGTKFDDATDNSGKILRGVEGDYYSYTVGTPFAIGDNNFTVQVAVEDAPVKLLINRKEIALAVDNFVGINKAYDGTNTVSFGDTLAYNLANALARVSDDVRLGFTAVYTGVGEMKKKTEVGIKFSNLCLEGEDAINYTLTTLAQSGKPTNKIFDGENEIPNDVGHKTVTITATVSLTIYYIDSSLENSNLIYITMGAISVLKSDFLVEKVYDGSASIVKSDVKINDRTDINGGSKMLVQLWQEEKSDIAKDSATTFGGSAVSDNYVVSSLTLHFYIKDLKNTNDISINNVDPDISFRVTETGRLDMTIKNLDNARITHKMLGVDSFTSIEPKAQDYSGNAGAGLVKNTVATLSKGQVIEGDVLDVKLVTRINDGNFNAGEHTVEFVEMGAIGDENKTTVSNSNYKVDVDALNKYYAGENALKVTVNKAKLIPNVKFDDMQYNGVAQLATPTGQLMKSELSLVTENYTKELESELERMSVNSTGIKYYLSKKGAQDPNVAVNAYGDIVAHDVLVNNLIIALANGTDSSILDNYVMYGGRYNPDTNSYDEVTPVAGSAIQDYEMLGAIVVTRKVLTIYSNNVIIRDKIYDGTKNADIAITLDTQSGLVDASQADIIQVTATGTFERSTIGRWKVNISNVRLGLKEGYTDDASKALLNNYTLPYFLERREASILPRPVAVMDNSANLGEKTYDGSPTVGVRNIDISLELATMVNSNDEQGYGVQVDAGYAYYMDKNVNLSGKEVVNKDGTVYNPVLRNTRGTVNYQLAIRSDSEIAGGTLLAQFKDVDTGAITYYYALPTTDKYITEETYAELPDADKAFVAGSYLLDGKHVYLMDSSYDGTALDLGKTLTYIKGVGKIKQRPVSVSASSIELLGDADHQREIMTKVFDGTKFFFGVQDKDYRYKEGGIVGAIAGDDVRITDVTAEYETAYTTANYVVFTPKAIDGADKDNYRVDGKMGSARLPGKIYSRDIEAVLKNGEMEYGTSLNMVKGDIVYSAVGNDGTRPWDTTAKGDRYELTEWDGGLFMTMKKYTEMMNFKLGSYQDALMTRIYIEAGNGFEKIDPETEIGENEMGNYYIRLSGIYSLPSVKVTFRSTPTVGTKSSGYTLTKANTVNYSFVPVYYAEDGTTPATTATLTVAPKTLYVSTRGTHYSKYYGASEPEVELFFYDKDGNNGFAPSENAYNVFVQGNVNYSPVVRWGIFDTAEKKWIEQWGNLTDEGYKYAKYSTDLVKENPNYVYMAYLVKPENADYESNALIKNYKVVYQFAEGKYTFEEGKVYVKYVDESDFVGAASFLDIMQPTMAGLTMRSGTTDVEIDPDRQVYKYTYNGNDFATNTMYGVNSNTDTVKMTNPYGDTEYYDSVMNAGRYVGKIYIRRDIKVDEGDTNGYFNVWESANEIVIDIAKASPLLKVVSSSKYYDGEKYEYKVSGGENMITYRAGGLLDVKDGYADISYELLKANGEYESVDEMLNAGTYRVTVALNDTFEKNNPNHYKETKTATYTVMKARVNVLISADGYTDGGVIMGEKTLIASYDANRQYTVGYGISNSAETPTSLHLKADQTELEIKGDINSPGRYAFEIKLKEGVLDINNYRLVDAKGVIELTTKTVVNGNASVELESEAVVNRLVAKQIAEGKGSGSDIELWTSIKEYMPYVDKNASLASVVRLELYCDDRFVEYNGGNISLSVAIPDEVGDLDGKAVYMVTRNGTLVRLEDYTVRDGKIEYTTDYLGALVFVDLTPYSLPLWLKIVIGVSVSLFVIAVTWTVVALVVRKSRLKKLA